MTVITLSTVGYREVHTITPAGRVFTMILILTGVGFVFYLMGSIIQFMMEGSIREILGRRKLEKGIRKQKGHYIICGYGRVGASICDTLSSYKPVAFVVIDRDPQRIEKIEERGFHHVQGEATDEENLIKAGVERARGLVAVLKTDSDNVYVTLTARHLNPDLFIIARAGEEKSEKKLLSAGADKVVSPYRMGAHRIAQMISRPAVTDFLDLTTMAEGHNILMEEVAVDPSSDLIGVALQDSGIRQKLNLIIVGVKKPGGDMLFNPSSQTTLEGGDTVVAIGEKKNLESLARILNPAP
ncbi:MAG: potassium channel protein [Deltaproteobacteria bacterium]|nr:potassium channel protein [Deltaproteobacteria bacterium]